MRTISILIFVVILFCSFKTKNKSQPYAYDISKGSSIIIDSLKQNGIDTILLFYNGCSGCIMKKEDAYVIWKKNSTTKCIRLNTYVGQFKVQIIDDIFIYLNKNIDSIKYETLKNGYWQSHFHYIEITMNYNGIIFNKLLPDYYVTQNDDSYLINWIFRIKSSLFDIDWDI